MVAAVGRCGARGGRFDTVAFVTMVSLSDGLYCGENVVPLGMFGSPVRSELLRPPTTVS